MRNEVFTSSRYHATIRVRIEETDMGQAKPISEQDDDLDAVVGEVLRTAGGDVRKAILGLVRGQHAIEAEKANTVCAGYVRRGLPRA